MEDNYKEVKKEEPCLKLIHMDQVEVEEIEWLFYPFIPYGKVTIIQGDPGEGKTTVVLQIIAKLTKGEAILSETSEGKSEEIGVEPINVIYQTAEDGLGDTIKPRLLAAGADCSRVLVIDDQEQPLTMVDARLEEAIIQTKARLVVLDPIQPKAIGKYELDNKNFVLVARKGEQDITLMIDENKKITLALYPGRIEIDQEGKQVNVTENMTDEQRKRENELLSERKEELMPILHKALELWEAINN